MLSYQIWLFSLIVLRWTVIDESDRRSFGTVAMTVQMYVDGYSNDMIASISLARMPFLLDAFFPLRQRSVRTVDRDYTVHRRLPLDCERWCSIALPSPSPSEGRFTISPS